jgi:hypothetical protein
MLCSRKHLVQWYCMVAFISHYRADGLGADIPQPSSVMGRLEVNLFAVGVPCLPVSTRRGLKGMSLGQMMACTHPAFMGLLQLPSRIEGDVISHRLNGITPTPGTILGVVSQIRRHQSDAAHPGL